MPIAANAASPHSARAGIAPAGRGKDTHGSGFRPGTVLVAHQVRQNPAAIDRSGQLKRNNNRRAAQSRGSFVRIRMKIDVRCFALRIPQSCPPFTPFYSCSIPVLLSMILQLLSYSSKRRLPVPRFRGCRKRRIEAYQGLSVRLSCQRQSGAKGINVQVFFSKAPAVVSYGGIDSDD